MTTLLLPWISWIAALSLVMIPRQNDQLIKRIALAACALSSTLVFILALRFKPQDTAYQFVSRVEWLPSLGIHYAAGLDGLGLTFCLLHAIISLAAVFLAFSVRDRLKEYLVFYLVLTGALYGVFTSLNLFFLYVFYEMTLLAVYPMIAVWGSGKKEYAAIQMAVYTGLGAIVALFGLFLLYQEAGAAVFDLAAVRQNPGLIVLSEASQSRLAPFFLLSLGVLSSLWPLHSWAPTAYASAPASTAMLHAGVKAGPYLLLRIAAAFLPEGMRAWAEPLAVIATIGILYAGYAALRQKNLRLMLGFSGVSHLGYVFLGIAVLSAASISGAVFLVFAHGLLTAALFAAAGILIQRTQNEEIHQYGGLAKSSPFLAICLIAASMASLGMPGFANFASELMILISAWPSYPWLTAFAVLGILITSLYLLRMIQTVCFGSAIQAGAFKNTSFAEKFPLALLIGALLLFGIWPEGILQFIKPAAGALLP